MSENCVVDERCTAGRIVAKTNAAIEAVVGSFEGMEAGTKMETLPGDVGMQPLVVHLGLPMHDVDHLIVDISTAFWAACARDGVLTTHMVRGFIGQCLLAGHFAGQVSRER